jgi:hypothetical protein
MAFFSRLLLNCCILLCVLCCSNGCEFVGIPKTNDPVDKLKWAHAAYLHGRSLAAEQLLNEAIKIFTSTNNELMLGCAYNFYGQFELEYGNKEHALYFKRAIAYFEKSLYHFDNYYGSLNANPNEEYYKESIQHATNSAFTLGELLQLNNDNAGACKYFDISYKYYKMQKEYRPGIIIQSPGYGLFEEALQDKRNISKCK